MDSNTRKRKPRSPACRLETREPSSPVLIAVPRQSSGAAPESNELPSREALVLHLEAQRAELVRAMSDVNLARWTIEQHVAGPLFGGQSPETPEQHALYRRRVLEALTDAAEALRTAYPTLERIAQALAVEAILKGLMPTNEASAAESAGTELKAGLSERRRTVR